jgi:uncharacterized protein
MEIKPPTKICIKQSPVHGLGVFATDYIKSGEVIEECPIYLMNIPKGEMSSCMIDYRYNFPKSEYWTHQAITWGYGSLYNHSENANADWRDNMNNNGTFEFYALKDIMPDEEIFIYYGGVDYWSDGRKNIDVK